MGQMMRDGPMGQWMGGWFGTTLALLLLLLVVVAVVGLVVALVRGSGPGRGPDGSAALEELRLRYARGEIDQAEFDERRRVLGA